MKVFSKEKYIEWAKSEGHTQERIKISLQAWVNECDGLTKEEMWKKGFDCADTWLCEKEDKKEKEKITVKEFFESDEHLAIHCDTEEKANKLLEEFDKLGYKWASGDSYSERNRWIYYEKDTCYSNRRGYGTIDFYKVQDYTIYEFEDIIFEKDLKEEIPTEDIKIFKIPIFECQYKAYTEESEEKNDNFKFLAQKDMGFKPHDIIYFVTNEKSKNNDFPIAYFEILKVMKSEEVELLEKNKCLLVITQLKRKGE